MPATIAKTTMLTPAEASKKTPVYRSKTPSCGPSAPSGPQRRWAAAIYLIGRSGPEVSCLFARWQRPSSPSSEPAII